MNIRNFTNQNLKTTRGEMFLNDMLLDDTKYIEDEACRLTGFKCYAGMVDASRWHIASEKTHEIIGMAYYDKDDWTIIYTVIYPRYIKNN